MIETSTESYILCGTPRTGSTLLCALLESTGVAGKPESYFREPDELSMAMEWGIVDSVDGTYDFADYVRASVAAGSSANGVFATRIMWGSLDRLVVNWRAIYVDVVGTDLDLLYRAFGPVRFVYLQRDDVLAQAISLFRAEQTNLWHVTDDAESAVSIQQPTLNFDEIHALTEMIAEHNLTWQAWFRSVGVTPHVVRFEDLAADPIGITRNVLAYLNIDVPPDREITAPNRRLADGLTSQWIDRYRMEARSHSLGRDGCHPGL